MKLSAEVCLNLKRKRFNLNCWAAREILTGRPAKRSAPAGCLSGCPHSSVTRGWAKRYGATWIVRSSSNPKAGSHSRRETTPTRQKPSAASGGCWGLTGMQARVVEAGKRQSRRRRTQGWSRQLLGWTKSTKPSPPLQRAPPAKFRRTQARAAPARGGEGSVRRGEWNGVSGLCWGGLLL